MSAMCEMQIRPLTSADAPACDAIIASLPYFFGDPAGVLECAQAVRSQRGCVAILDGDIVAFMTIHKHAPASAEITWMAIHAARRRGGLGRNLMTRMLEDLKLEGVRLVCVLTLGPSVAESAVDNYEGTRRFYEAIGFIPLRELGPRSWSDSAALMLARAI